MTHKLAVTIATILTGFGAHNVTASHCGRTHCHGHADIASPWTNGAARCRFTIKYRPRLRPGTATAYGCVHISKWTMMSDVTERRSGVAQ